MKILSIETSCDETAAAVVEGLGVRDQVLELKVLSNIVASQVKIHAKTGGVVPEVAARAHVEKIISVVERALKQAHPLLNPPPSRGREGGEIDVIAVTAGPGLVTSLLVGVEVARTLSWLWKKPVVAVNHLAGHIYANWISSPQPSPLTPTLSRGERGIEAGRGGTKSNPSPLGRGQGEGNIEFPALCLIVSGGHTELVLMKNHLDFKIIGETRDDAAGEAFDKVAKMLGLPYPGGPAISAQAAKVSGVRDQVLGIRSELKPKTYNLKPVFPRPMIDSPDFDFSFSGLKTAVLYWLRAKSKEQRASKPYALRPTLLAAACYEFQEAVVDVLVTKTIRAAKQYKVKTVLLGGGVAANKRLRQQLVHAIQSELPTTYYVLPSLQYSTDNAAMIAAAGYFMAQQKQFTPTPKNGGRRPLVRGVTPWDKLDVDPNWELGKKFKPIAR